MDSIGIIYRRIIFDIFPEIGAGVDYISTTMMGNNEVRNFREFSHFGEKKKKNRRDRFLIFLMM